MYNFNPGYVLEHMAQIISNSRYGDELFFTDCNKAASDILRFLESENALVRCEGVAIQ
jgi:hypothetical protein